MCGRILIGALASSCLLATAPETSQAFEIQQVQTERGNVPLYLPSATGTDAELPSDFETQFELIADYLGLVYREPLYCCCADGFNLQQHQQAIQGYLDRISN